MFDPYSLRLLLIAPLYNKGSGAMGCKMVRALTSVDRDSCWLCYRREDFKGSIRVDKRCGLFFRHDGDPEGAATNQSSATRTQKKPGRYMST